MQHRRSPNSAENQSSLVGRILNSLKLMLLSRLFRLAGWGAVVGLPAMVRTPRRFASLVKGYPIGASTICLALLVCVAVWNETAHPRPAEFEIESIDHIEGPTELIAISSPLLLDSQLESASPRPDKFADPVEPAALGKPQAETQSADDTRIVWLTGRIEEFPNGEPATPVRSAVRFPSNRR